MAFKKGPWKGTKGLNEAKENLVVNDEGDCPRCGGGSTSSSIPGYLICERCRYEWSDPNYSSNKRRSFDSVNSESAKVRQFKEEMESGAGLSQALGIDSNLSNEQEQGLNRLQDRWITGMQGHFNVAEEARKPLIINFDSDDNIVDTQVGKLTLLTNDFDGGEEIRIEYPGRGTEFYCLNDVSETGWRKGKNSEGTARNIASIINKYSQFVFAQEEGNQVLFELRDNKLKPSSLVLYIDDPGGKDIVAEKDGVALDAEAVSLESDYQTAVELVLSDGIITPSEDQLLWAMRQHLGISEEKHIGIVVAIFGDGVLKECTGCGETAPLYLQHQAWYCEECEMWL